MNNNLKLKLTKNFSLGEFLRSDYASEHCLDNSFPKDWEAVFMKRVKSIAVILQQIRDCINEPIRITSGFRSLSVNRGVGGVINSRHLYMCAVDIAVPSLCYGDSLVHHLSFYHPRFVKYYPDKGYVHVDWCAPYLENYHISRKSSTMFLDIMNVESFVNTLPFNFDEL